MCSKGVIVCVQWNLVPICGHGGGGALRVSLLFNGERWISAVWREARESVKLTCCRGQCPAAKSAHRGCVSWKCCQIPPGPKSKIHRPIPEKGEEWGVNESLNRLRNERKLESQEGNGTKAHNQMRHHLSELETHWFRWSHYNELWMSPHEAAWWRWWWHVMGQEHHLTWGCHHHFGSPSCMMHQSDAPSSSLSPTSSFKVVP